MDYKKYIAGKLNIDGVAEDEVASFIEVPPSAEVGDLALPCFKFSKILRRSPIMIASQLKDEFVCDDVVNAVEAVNGYLNFRLNKSAFCERVLSDILAQGERYGSSDEGKGKTICLDYSSINIAKPFHIGHLSTTVIGAALYRIFSFLGYKAVGINHLGDYGTQFGKLIYAYKKWGDRSVIEQKGLKEITRLYVKYHEEAEADPSMDDVAREYFKKIEDGDKECLELFEYFKKITLAEIDKIYDLLGVKFDSYAGESFYNDKMAAVVDKLRDKGLLKESQGAMIVDLSEYDMPPRIILRSDGASLYATRDLAAAYYRKNTYDFYKCLYVVAYQQDLHFRQIFKVLELLGEPWAKDMVHVSYGMVSLEDGAMSTRKGHVVLLEDVLNKTIEKALKIIDEKNPDLENKEDAAKKIGVGAVVFGALSTGRIKDITFSYDKVLSFEGETGPYVQYTVARANSVLKKGEKVKAEGKVSDVGEEEFAIVKQLETFPQAVKAAADRYEPFYITRFALDTAKLFNKFYFDCKIVSEDEERSAFRLKITEATKICLTAALALLGIKAPEKM